jgi:hypothetical protein
LPWRANQAKKNAFGGLHKQVAGGFLIQDSKGERSLKDRSLRWLRDGLLVRREII